MNDNGVPAVSQLNQTVFSSVINEETNTVTTPCTQKDEKENIEHHIKDLTRLVRSVSINTNHVEETNKLRYETCGDVPGTSFGLKNSVDTNYEDNVNSIKENGPIDLCTESATRKQTAEHTDKVVATEILENIADQEEEYIHSAEWREKSLHLFVLTEAGKPVYSRHGSEDKLSTLMGVLLALVSCVQDSNDQIRHIIAGDHVFVFCIKTPLLLVAISSSEKSCQYAKICLQYLYDSIVSVLTLSQLEKIYKTQKNFDLRRLLTGTFKSLDYLSSSFDFNPQFMLNAVKCLKFPGHLREVAGHSLQQAKTNDLAFAILIAHQQVVNICRLKEHVLKPSDLHLILNLINSSTAFHAGESWTPICLPCFNAKGYLHAHISYLDDNYKICLLLLSADRDAFFALSENKNKVLAKLNRQNCLQTLIETFESCSYKMEDVAVPEILHFLYKSKSTSQYTSPDVGAPYTSNERKLNLYRLYQNTHGLLHNPGNPRKLVYSVTSTETILGWATTGFELYAVFNPLVQKHTAISAVNRLLRWIKTNNGDLFISQPSFF